MTDSGTDESHSASPLPVDDPMQDQSQEQDEEAECRVCRGEAELERRLFSPCKCSGSIRYAHSDCLEQWLIHSGKKVCELCRYEFKFRPIYDPNTPKVLPWTQLIGSLLKVTCMEWIPFLVRSLLVLILWSAVAPWCTSWLYRMWLLRASAMVNVNFSERLHPAEIMTDIYSGIFLVVCIIFSFLSLISFAEFWRSHLDQENEVVDERMQFPVWPVNLVVAREEMEQPQGGQDMEDQDWDENVLQHEDVVEDAEPEAEDENRREPEQELRHRMPERRPDRAMFFADGPDADAIAAAPVHRNDAWEVNNNNNIPPNNRAWEDDMDHLEINIALDELLGFRGDFLVLFRNVSWFLAFNGAHLGLFAFIPYTLGSSILSALGKLLMSVPFWSGMMPMVQNSTAFDENPVVDQTSIVSLIITSLIKHVSLAQKNGDCIQLVDLFTCAMGYVSICFTILLWRFMIKTVSSYTRRPLMGGLIWILRCLGALVKVSSLLFMKMIILPIILGLGIDFATLSLVKGSFSGRLLYCLDRMMEAIMVHWVLGITFMLFVTVSVLQLREVLHPDILGRGIRPQEAHTELLRSLLSESYSRHARRLFLSIVVYAILLIVVIHTPVRIASWLQPAWFPFTLHFQHYNRQLQVPLELVVIHLVALGILEHTKNEVGHWQHLVIKVTSKILGLTAFLLPRIKATEVDETQFPQVKKQSEFVLSPPPLHFNPQAAAPPERLRIKGRRYFPWPEDDVEVTAPQEYTLLPRTEVSASVYARLAALVVICTIACIITVGVSIFGALVLGRYAMAPIEKIFGVYHDPLAMGAGVLILWFIVHCVNAVSVLLRSDEQIGPVLLQHGFCVKNLTPVNAAACVIGWGFMCPLLVGILLTSCAPALKCTWMECFWLGYLVFNLTVWLYCCFQSAREHQEPRPEENPAVDDGRNLLDERDNQAQHDDAAPGNRPINAHGAAILIEGHDPRDHDVLQALRQSYQQLNFTLSLLDSDRAHVQNGNLSDRCLDVGRFHDKVLVPVLTTLISALVASSISATIIRALCLSNWFRLMFISLIENYAFVVSLLSLLCISAFSGARVQFSRWLTSLRDRMRNERYLVGRQLQDRAR